MIHKDESLLSVFRNWPYCELCGRKTPEGCDPAHILSRGAGRVDIAENLCGLCRHCHRKVHDGNISNLLLFVLAGHREHLLIEDCQENVWAVRRAKKG